MKKLIIGMLIAGLSGCLTAHAQTTTAANNASTTAASSAANQGNAQNITFDGQAPDRTHATVANVSAPILGAYASSFSQLNCGSTTQAGLSVPGFSGAFGTSTEGHACVLMVAAQEVSKGSTVEPDATVRAKALQAATNLRCMVNSETYDALVSAGLTCQTKPKDYMPTQQVQ